MGDLEREEIEMELLEYLDSIDEVMENAGVEDDEGFDEIADLVQRIRLIILKE